MKKCKSHKSCIKEALIEAKIICDQRGVNLTKLRETVLKLIWKNHSYVKAYDLLDELRKIDHSAKPPTVYRSLDFLMQNGFIHKIQSLNAFVGCSHLSEHNECYFLICKECQSIEECHSKNISEFVQTTSNTNNFSANQVTFEISGICQECIQ